MNSLSVNQYGAFYPDADLLADFQHKSMEKRKASSIPALLKTL
jgi:hypothetical protein